MVAAPVGMNSVEFNGRPACLYDGWCHVGCPIGALANPQVTYLGDARQAGAEVRAWSTVTPGFSRAIASVPQCASRLKNRASCSSPMGT